MENLIKTSTRTPKYIGLDYIGTSYDTYIDTGYIIPKTYFKLDFSFSKSKYQDFDTVFGEGNGSSGSFNFMLYCANSSNFFLSVGTKSSLFKIPFSIDTIYNYTFRASNGNATISEISSPSVLYSGNYTGNLQSFNSSSFTLGAELWYSYCKIYSAKMYSDDTTLVRDYMPVQRYSDGALGLYDKIEQKFYENAGSGAFISGGYNAKNNIY